MLYRKLACCLFNCLRWSDCSSIFVRFNDVGEVEYIFVNPLFRKKGIAKKLLKLVKTKTGNKIILQKPISPLGAKLLKYLEK